MKISKNFSYIVLSVVVALAFTAVVAQATNISTKIVLAPVFDGSSSEQSVEADAEFDGFSGGYGAAVMGHAFGTIAAGDSIVGGLIGKYNIATNPSDEPAGAVLGEVGEDSAGTLDGAFVAYIGGDSGAVTAPAAYTVRNLNSTNGNGFAYGLDLNTTTVTGYQPLTFSAADIRLNSAATIGSGTTAARPATCVKGSIYLNTTTGIMDGCTATNTWTAYDLTD